MPRNAESPINRAEMKARKVSNYVTLAPRQKITFAPYAIQAVTANNALNLGGMAANQYVLTDNPRLDGSNYVQNSTTTQPGVNFNVGGTGTTGVFNDATQFNLGGQKIIVGETVTTNPVVRRSV